MADLVLTKTRIRAGVWEGVLTAPGAAGNVFPDVEVLHQDMVLSGVVLDAVPGAAHAWTLRFAIPADALGDGVHSFVIRDRTSEARLGAFAVVTGAPLDDDIRAELDLLRAELDLLKRAFRRHCVETAG